MRDAISISCTDLGVDYQDAGPWRNYEMCATGNSVEEMMEDATITEVDQDGGELNTYGLDDASNEVRDAAVALIKRVIEKAKCA